MSTPLRLGFKLSKSVKDTIQPPIPQAYNWISQYMGSLPLINMSQGVPGTLPPLSVQDALKRVSGFGYTQVLGDEIMKRALVDEMKSIYAGDSDLNVDDVGLTSGCNLAFYAVIMCLAEKGDEVILPVPWYFNHQMALTLLGITPISLRTFPKDNFVPSAERAEELITERTRAIALVTPNNPTGAIYSPSLLAQFLALAQKHNIALIIDETYRDFLPPKCSPHTLFTQQTWRQNLISLFSFSKSYSLPGHRLGAVIASPNLLSSPLTKVLDTIQICAPRPIQLALAPLLPSLRPFIRVTADHIDKRHTIFKNELSNIRGNRWVIGSQGGYYAFVKHPFQGKSSMEVCERLVRDLGVVVLPEEFFVPENDGKDLEETRWIRFSVANVDDESVRIVCRRMGEATDVWGWDLVVE